MKLHLVLMFFILFFADCSSKVKSEARRQSEPNSIAKVIGYLETRDYKMTIWSSSSGPLYSVATKSGKIILNKKTMEEIKAEETSIYLMLNEALANQSSGIIDASHRKTGQNMKDVIERTDLEFEINTELRIIEIQEK